MERSELKSIQVVVHCLPREIDHLERILNSLYESYTFVEGELKFILDVTLNLNENFTDWKLSKLDSSFFENKFYMLQQIHSWADVKFEVDRDGKCLGINDKRRQSINDDVEADYILYLDLDLFFPKYILLPLNQILQQIDKSKHVIISPELVKLWDNSWDGLVNSRFINEEYGYYSTFNPYLVNKVAYNNLLEGNIGVRELSVVKFGGGWFNLFSKSLLKFINIPSSLGSYGLDDTYVMNCANLMKQKDYEVTQYILEGIVCAENIEYSTYKFNPYSEFLHDFSFIEKGRGIKEKGRKQANTNFQKELQNFYIKL